MKYIKCLCFIICLLSAGYSHAQQFHRITGKMFIKDSSHDNKKNMIAGKFFYDKNHRKLIYDFSFPRREKLVCIDTVNYKYINDKYIGRELSMSVPESSLFHLALTGKMSDFGLKESFYKVSDVSREGDLVITTWMPPVEAAKGFGKVIVSQKDKKLHGVAIYDHKGTLVNKQIVKSYTRLQGLDFPSEVLYVYYLNNKESLRLISFKEIRINDYDDESIYNFPLPK